MVLVGWLILQVNSEWGGRAAGMYNIATFIGAVMQKRRGAQLTEVPT